MTTIRIKLSPQLIKMGEEELLIEIDESVLSRKTDICSYTWRK